MLGLIIWVIMEIIELAIATVYFTIRLIMAIIFAISRGGGENISATSTPNPNPLIYPIASSGHQ